MRTFAEKTYGIPPHQILGSTIKTQCENRDGTPVIMRLPELNFFCDGRGKPVEIQRVIGSRDPSWLLEIRTATWRCWNIRPPAVVSDSGP